MSQLGINEALILAALSGRRAQAIDEIAELLRSTRNVNEGSVYMALQRMAKRGLVERRESKRTANSGRVYVVGVYDLTDEGTRALDDFAAQAEALPRLRLTSATA